MTREDIEIMRRWIREYYRVAGHQQSAGMADKLCDLALKGLNAVQLAAQITTLIEDFDNPCFGGKMHNEIPHHIGLLVIEAAKKERYAKEKGEGKGAAQDVSQSDSGTGQGPDIHAHRTTAT
jgi:hypothetical protein